MANPEHVAILIRGTKTWNTWREVMPGVRPELSNINFRGANLSEADLRGANLRGANLSNANLTGANLSNTNLTGANLSLADLKDVNLSKANLRGANLSNDGLSKTNLRGADLSEADLKGANLRGTNLSNANLTNTNLGEANLRNTDLQWAKLDASLIEKADFSNANLRSAYLSNLSLGGIDLSGSNLRNINLRNTDLKGAILINADLHGIDLSGKDLRDAQMENANLRGADLRNANFAGVNLSFANLSGAFLLDTCLFNANLSNAILYAVQALGTNLNNANLTGACIQDWNINTRTNLEDIICEYVFQKVSVSGKYEERRPSSGNFAQGDFTKLVQKSISTVDLIFRNGINWEAFAHSFQKLQVQTGSDELDIHSIENKGDGDFVIRVNTPLSADKAKIQEFVMEEYGKELKVIEAKYEKQLRLKSEQYSQRIEKVIEAERQKQTQLIGVINVMAENQGSKFDLRGAHIAGGIADTVQGDQIGTQYNYAPEKQDLAEAAADIQKLLKQIEETNPTATALEKQTFISMGIGPTKKQRLINAVQSGGKAAIEEFLNNPYLNVAIAIIEGWKENEGSE